MFLRERERERGQRFYIGAACSWEEKLLMERRGIVVCSVVGFLGLLCAATGFAAEATRIKVK